MKNYLPFALAVILGLSAVFAVSRLMKGAGSASKKTISVVAVSRDLDAGETITEDVLFKKTIDVSARSREMVEWSRRALVLNQVVALPIPQQDYILGSQLARPDDRPQPPIGEVIVTVPLNSAIGTLIRPGDEVSIISTREVKVAEKNLAGDTSTSKEEVTYVLFPRVNVLGMTGGRGGLGEMIISLPNDEALALARAKIESRLDILLRNRKDDTNLDPKSLPTVNSRTLDLDASERPKMTIHENAGVAKFKLKTP